MRGIPLALVLAAGLCAVVPARARAQPQERSARAVRVDAAPVIDGRLDDAAWELAEQIDGFRQRDPAQGQPASEETSVRIVYDRASLYIGALLGDREPGRILARALRRDSDFDSDDRFAVILDTFHDHRNGFVFTVNPNGAMSDGIVRNEASPDGDWDEQWFAAVSVGQHGWSVELQIPFKVLRFRGGESGPWGIDFERVIRRKNEEVYWANWSRNFDFEQVSQAGLLTGLEGIAQGQRVRLRPYVVGGIESIGAVEEGAGSIDPLRSIGLDDGRIGVTPNLVANVAVNPDFAQTEADTRRVNLSRFNLFFPEKRRFFVEGAASLRMGIPEDFGDESLQLFHSRRIGLSPDGEPTPLAAGAKLTGKVSGTDIGVLGAREAASNGMAAENFGVVRFQREVLNRSYFGAIVTGRDGQDSGQTTVGADAQLVLTRYLRVSTLLAAVGNADGGRSWATFLGGAWNSDFFDASAAYLDVDPGFDPALGFVRRQDRQVQGSVSVKPRPKSGPIRQLFFTPAVVAHHDPRGTLLTREIELEAQVELQSGDETELSYVRSTEALPEPFEISDSIVLPVRRYDWDSLELEVRTFDGRPLSGSIAVGSGGFYSGARRYIEISPDLRAGRHLALSPNYSFNDIRLAEGSFRTHLLGARVEASFTRNVLTSAFIQYDSEGRLASTQVRLNWILRNIDNFYVVYNETRFTAGPLRGRTNRSLLSKLTYSLYR